MNVNKSTKSVIGFLIMGSLSFAGCGKITVQVKKDAKNSTLQSTPNAAESSASTSLADSDDFLKQLDGLRTTAAGIIVKQLAAQDYVGKFRSGVRKYRKFLHEKAQTNTVLKDSFYTDTTQTCREQGFNINIDKDNEVLGMLLQTALLAKISEVNVGKLNSGLTTELQALSQIITMELGVDISGTSSADKDGEMDIAKGDVSIKLKPIKDENIDDATKLADETEVLNLSFERKVGKDRIGTFSAEMSLSSTDSVDAVAKFDVSRSKSSDKYIHIAAVTMGLKNQEPSYSRQIIVTEIPGEKMKFAFTDILNAGKSTESINQTIIDLDKKNQCKLTDSDKDDLDGKDGNDDKNVDNEPKGGEEPMPSPTPTPTPTPTQSPAQNPTQSPSQTPSQTPVKK